MLILELDLDLDQFAARSHTMIYKTKGRDVHQVVFQIEPFIVKNNKLHAVTGFTIIPHAVKKLASTACPTTCINQFYASSVWI